MITQSKISIIAIHGNDGGGFRFELAKLYYPVGAGPFLANKVIGHKSLDHNKNIRHGS